MRSFETTRAIVTILMVTSISLGQTAWLGLTPGRSARSDADKKLGQPVKNVSETLLEYADSSGQKVYVQLRPGTDLIDRVEILYAAPVDRAAIASMLSLAPSGTDKKWDSRGRLEEYFGAPHFVVLTYASSDAASRVIRAGYYSSGLYEVAMQKPVGAPQKAAPASGSLAGAERTERPEAKTFKDVDLLVPKGDKSESKSVRLLFDGDTIVIDADRGEKIYKQFPYQNVVSGEYSYSTSPRWKTAVGAAILIGVFALPLFFMKGRKHWLTIKTADDFAILRLDKDNYKMILATFETSVGKKVEKIQEGK